MQNRKPLNKGISEANKVEMRVNEDENYSHSVCAMPVISWLPNGKQSEPY